MMNMMKNMMDVLESHSRIPDYSGNVVSKFQVDEIKTQGEIASYKNVPRIIRLQFRCKINIFGHIWT